MPSKQRKSQRIQEREKNHPAVAEENAEDENAEEENAEEQSRADYIKSLGLNASSSNTSSSSSSEDDDDTPHSRKRPSAKVAENTDEPGDVPPDNNGGDGSAEDESAKIPRKNTNGDEEPTTQEYDNDNNLASTAYEATQNNAKLIQTLYEKISSLNSNNDLAVAEIKALRSEICKPRPPTPATAATSKSAKIVAAASTKSKAKVPAKTTKTSRVNTDKQKDGTSASSKAAQEKQRGRSRSPHQQRAAKKSKSPSPRRRSYNKNSSSPRRRSSRKSSSPDERHRRKHRSHNRKRKRSSSSSRRTSPGNSSSSSPPRRSRRRSRSPSYRSPTPPPTITPNQYTPAPIPTSDVKKIEKGLYVNFKRLRPRCIDQKTREERSSNVEMKFSSETGTYSFERTNSETIESFTRWMQAWNAFYQTHLSFRPHDAFLLFSYLKLISTLATQFKFPAVYSYDVDFRHAIATQRKVPPTQRTAIWGVKNAELANAHLTEDQRLPPPKCYVCNDKGHLANNCPNPPKQKEGGRSASKNEKGGQKNEFRNENEIDTCFHWNKGKCNRGATCRFLHKCSNCRSSSEHKGPNCPRERDVSTRFRPGN